MSVLPPKRDPVLFVHPNAVPSRLIALQQFETIPYRHDKIIQPTSRVNHLQFPLHDPPQLARYASRCPRVPFPKQVGRCLVGE
jgi:hypothetical protein